jgi:uncharacterized protein (TIGR02444 family)
VGIWDWALEAYARPGVAEACLALQDAHGQNTSLLLWAVWAEVAEADVLARAAEDTRAWEAAALLPIRQARRALKAPLPPFDDRAREALREDVKALELQTERLLMETLAGLAPRNGGAPALTALTAASEAWGPPAPAAALADLAAALG